MAKKRLPKIITGPEATSLLAGSSNGGSERGVRDRLMLELMYRAGLRVGEVVALTQRDVGRDGIVRIHDGKGGDGTAYFTPDEVLPHLDAWLEVRARWLGAKGLGSATGPLFVHRDGKPVSKRYVQRLVQRLRERLGIQGKCTPHVLRHTFATEALEDGFSLVEVQSLLRHAHLATTAVYLHVRDEGLRRKMTGRRRAG